MAVFSSYAPVIDGVGLPTVQPGFRVPSGDPGLGIHAIENPAIVGPSGWPSPWPGQGFGEGFGATVIDPTGVIQPYQGNGLGLISPTDAWLTGRPYGLPGTTAIQTVRLPDGSYASRMLGDVPNDFEASVDLQRVPYREGWYRGRELRVDQPAGLALAVNEVQRSVGFGGVSDRLGLDLGIFGKPSGKIMLGVIGGTIVLGIIGAIVAAD